MKKLIYVFLVLALSLFAGLAFAAPEIIQIGHVFAPDHPVNKSLEANADWLKEQSKGRYELRVYPATTYASQKNSIQAVRLGALDVFILVNPIDYYKPAGVLLAPYTFVDYEHWKKFKQSDLYKQLLVDIGKSMGVHQMDLFTFGFRHATTKNKPCKTPQDFNGLKMRVVNFAPYPEAANVLGAIGTPIPLSELYMALSTGVVDAQENPYSQIYFMKFFEQQKYMIKTGHMLATDGWIMSNKRWNSLNDADKAMFTDFFRRSAQYIDDETVSLENELQQKLQDGGMTVIEVDKAPFMARAAEVMKKYPEWTELYNKIQDLK